jgi:Protein similar to CwfJ C-terminus 2
MKTARGRQRIRFYSEIGNQARFDMQFGRVLACHIMNQPEKLNWKNCLIDRNMEEVLVKQYKEAFKKN